MTTRPPLAHLLGSQLRWLRTERELTLEEVALRCDSYRGVVRRIEHGEHDPSIETIVRVAAALEADPVHDVLVVIADDYPELFALLAGAA